MSRKKNLRDAKRRKKEALANGEGPKRTTPKPKKKRRIEDRIKR